MVSELHDDNGDGKLMAYSIASLLRTGQLDSLNMAWRKVRAYFWHYRWSKSEFAYASAVGLIMDLGYSPLMAHEIAVQFNQQCDKRRSLFGSAS